MIAVDRKAGSLQIFIEPVRSGWSSAAQPGRGSGHADKLKSCRHCLISFAP
jgi:hypothetical protein